MLTPTIMRSRVLLALVFLSACSQNLMRVTDPSGTITSWHISSDVGGKTLWATITPRDLEPAPDWDLTRPGQAPVELDEAIRIARAQLGRYVPDSSTWEVTNIQIEKMTGLKWVIMVVWSPTDPSLKGTLTIPVLTSGRAVPLEEIKVKVGDVSTGG